jgi:hypothetical protein
MSSLLRATAAKRLPVDMTPHVQRALTTTTIHPVSYIDEDGQVIETSPVRREVVSTRIPEARYYTPEQVEQLLLQADELSVRITHLNLGRETVWRYGHAGIAVKKNGRTLAHLDGFPAEFVKHPDGTTEWAAVTNGKKQHMIKMFALTPESAVARSKFFNDYGTYENVGSIPLTHLSPERKKRAAARIRWAMEEINAADIPYIVPGLTVAEEIAHIVASRARKTDMLGDMALKALERALKGTPHTADVIRKDDDDGVLINVARAVGRRRKRLLATVASLQSGHNIVAELDDPEGTGDKTVILPAGANSKNIFEAVADLLAPDPNDPTVDPNETTPRQQVDRILSDFLAQPGFDDFRLPGGDSDLLHTALWLHAPKAWKTLHREKRNQEMTVRLQAVQKITTWAAISTAVVVMLQSGTQSFAVETMRLAQNKISTAGDPVEAFKQVTTAARDASNAATNLADQSISWHAFWNEWPLALGLAPLPLLYHMTPKPLRGLLPRPAMFDDTQNG